MSHDMPDHGYAVSLPDALCRAAEEYLALGLRIIALTGKAPNGAVHKHGLKEAFVMDTGVNLRRAFAHPKTTGIGILTGPPYVVDIDGPEGALAWQELVGVEESIRDTWIAKTGRGLHLYMTAFEEFPTTKLADKLDFKGAGGYVAAPPSLHPDGHRYEWLVAPGEPLLELPEALYEILYRRRVEAQVNALDRATAKARAPQALMDGLWYPVATFDGLLRAVREEPEGNRNGVLYWAARTMLEQGADEADIRELLDAAVNSGLTLRESRRTIRSAVGAGRG